MKAFLDQLYDYNVWANGLILKYAEQLPEEQFTQETTHSFGSIRDTLIHILIVEWLWREHMQGTGLEYAQALEQVVPEDYPTVGKLYHRWFDEELAMRNFLGDLDEQGVMQLVPYTNAAGRELEDSIAEILAHMVLHGMQHRAEAAAMLTDFGFSPGNLDYTAYLHAEQT
jgi:uncharacterized damage-inducible protein DinB